MSGSLPTAQSSLLSGERMYGSSSSDATNKIYMRDIWYRYRYQDIDIMHRETMVIEAISKKAPRVW